MDVSNGFYAEEENWKANYNLQISERTPADRGVLGEAFRLRFMEYHS